MCLKKIARMNVKLMLSECFLGILSQLNLNKILIANNFFIKGPSCFSLAKTANLRDKKNLIRKI
jgi:hypothetical protein